MADVTSIATIIGSLGAGSIAFFGGAAWVLRKVRGFSTRFDEFMEDWNGTKARPGVPHRPGVMERLSDQDAALAKIDGRLVVVEHEVNNNGGQSIKDIVHRMDGNLTHVRRFVDDMNTRVTNLERRGRS
jgi:hypothetical protein